MIILVFGAVLTAGLLVNLRYASTWQTVDLGSMSHQWVAANQASQPASSM